jgi:hypothetical protein
VFWEMSQPALCCSPARLALQTCNILLQQQFLCSWYVLQLRLMIVRSITYDIWAGDSSLAQNVMMLLSIA